MLSPRKRQVTVAQSLVPVQTSAAVLSSGKLLTRKLVCTDRPQHQRNDAHSRQNGSYHHDWNSERVKEKFASRWHVHVHDSLSFAMVRAQTPNESSCNVWLKQ